MNMEDILTSLKAQIGELAAAVALRDAQIKALERALAETVKLNDAPGDAPDSGPDAESETVSEPG